MMHQKELPSLTPELAARIEQCDIDYFVARLEALQHNTTNSFGVTIRQYGAATALMTQGTKNSLFNRVGGISRKESECIDTIIDWYRENKIRSRFDIVPSNIDPEILKHLAERGLYQSGFYTVLYGVPQISIDYRSNITVRAIEPAEREIFVDVYLNGFAFPEASRPFLRSSLQGLFDHPGTHFFFALVNTSIAGIGLLFLNKEIGYLATAATLPAFRGYGCQNALLQARSAFASNAGCDLVVGHTDFASISHHNMEKQGLHVAYTKAIWTEYKS
jgi:hypothetical protein